jgi:uncharacterized DUF497 family protein
LKHRKHQKKFDINRVEGFQWDENNVYKIFDKHKVDFKECEEVFFNRPLYVIFDVKNSAKEPRWISLGRTKANRMLFISFTLRGNQIRIISGRDMNKKERKIYAQKVKKYSGL